MNRYVWLGAPSVTDLPGLPGQGSANPASLFGNHKLVKLGPGYYDPSYGKSYTSLQDFEDNAIEGIVAPGRLPETTVGFDVDGIGGIGNNLVLVFAFRAKKNGMPDVRLSVP